MSLVGLGGWLVAGRALRPMRVIAETAEHVTASGLDQRIPVSNEDPEIARVIQVLNRMMDRLEASFRQATRFSADASHELKTPLAIMQGELENALQAAAPGSREQQVFSNLLEETQRLKTITRSLLLLAQADAGQLKLARETVESHRHAGEHHRRRPRPRRGESRLNFEVELAAGSHRPGRPRPAAHRAAQPVRQRGEIQRTRRHAFASRSNRGKTERGPNDRQLRPRHSRRRSGPDLHRFHRVDAARQRKVDGIGLGLSLAREIIRAHGGELELQESRPGWTRFRMRMRLGETGPV